ncbi:peptide chain release factor N(5)-glutamine methyltransferase [Oryzihumus leptocrescens]|uniref:Release factor glutamine methyltransferase n=1 Tax=Oryzihumus leptocrescens TaxID=297536 RepID=A0A542ZLY3_9MICO|nr:peptide chain release factor N(5)-glutamine methyltransferase [Oryzihumus leptocrescens]TQL61338.1 release factor glutamine methyltransferase [Oryzihumus leptocrescens]
MSGDLRAAVREASRRLAAAGVGSADVDAVALAAHALASTPAEVQRLMVLGAPEPEGLDELVEERARRVPLQHLTGRAGFRRLELSVGPGVFVPRPETEVVAGLAIRACEGFDAPVVVDLCTGSGAIALSVKDEVPAARVHAVELSGLAVAWASRNRDDLGLDVDLREGDATSAFPELEEAVDVVVSNPPYIPVGAVPLDPEVRDHDPELALYGGSDDGLAIPLAVAARAATLLRDGGVLVMEHADVQGESLPAALRATGCWADVHDEHDLTGRPRATVAVRAPRLAP